MRQPQRIATAIGDFRLIVVDGRKVALVTKLVDQGIVFVVIEVAA